MNGKSKTHRTKKPSKTISANEYWNTGFKAMKKQSKVIQEQLRRCEKESPELARSFAYLARFAEVSSARINRHETRFSRTSDDLVLLEPDLQGIGHEFHHGPPNPDDDGGPQSGFEVGLPITTCSTLREDYTSIVEEISEFLKNPTIPWLGQSRLGELQDEAERILTQMEGMGCVSPNILTPLVPIDFD